jgi:hypothetical protein
MPLVPGREVLAPGCPQLLGREIPGHAGPQVLHNLEPPLPVFRRQDGVDVKRKRADGRPPTEAPFGAR